VKILNLKFKNINSLSGENQIDFTNPIFTNNGLFAITGKTGAGKSTVLDAISLALYGKTPRVDVSVNDNAVMTRGEKDCYAEIVFETNGKIWKSSWKQEVNKNGKLKPVNRVIADSNNNMIADQVRTCDSKIIEIIGLTFEQFTKVILLAQGSFAAFLQADKNDKGQLLEQITGTEIYAEISKKVFERTKLEKEKLEKVVIELDAIQILTEEDIKMLTDEITFLEKEKKQADEEISKVNEAIKWISEIAILESKISEAQEKLPALETNVKNTSDLFEKAEIALRKAKEEQKTQEPIFKKVRELDTKISEKEKTGEPLLIAIPKLEKDKHDLSSVLVKQQTDLEESQKLLSDKEKWASDHKEYEKLVANYSALESENQRLIATSLDIEKLNTEIAKLRKRAAEQVTATQKATDAFIEKDQSLTKKIKEKESKRNELAQILEGKELAQLQKEKENLNQLSIYLRNLIEVEKDISANGKEIEDSAKKINQCDSDISVITEEKLLNNEKITKLEDQIRLMEENLTLRRTIQSLDEHRQQLKDGEECPLCGSLEHPFAKGNVPEIEEKERELNAQKNEFKLAMKSLQDNDKKLASLTSDKNHALANKAKVESLFSANTEKRKITLEDFRKIQPGFSMLEDDEARVEKLNKKALQTQKELQELNSQIQKASDIDKQIEILRDKEIPKLRNEKDEAEKQKTNDETTLKLARQELSSKEEAATQLIEKYKTENGAFNSRIKSYGVTTIEELSKCLNAWNGNTQQIESIKSQINTLINQIALDKNQLANLEKSYAEKQKEKQTLDAEKQTLLDERKRIFAEKSVEKEEARIKDLMVRLEAEKEKGEKEKNNAYTELEKYKGIVESKRIELNLKKEQKITEQSSEDLQKEMDEKKAKSVGFSEKIGANNEKLSKNAAELEASENKLKEKEKQQAIWNKWGKLNELIGSNDGKKYRNFAQALTFEHLIGLSNKQLAKMSDRYMLRRDKSDTSNPFELSVIDKYQNNEERTAQNLSGGEKFIVSLCLALGLANMASKNMQIDTMFIDEGFGTLDSDHLDLALNALSNLQNEGKLIGVISHIAELKERIATHIEIIPCGNGHSKIQVNNN